MNGAVVDQLLARTSSSGTTAWYLTDKLGSVRDIVSTSGSELDHIVYDSFGNIVTETNATNGDRFKFAGMQFDAVIGQYFDHARWYNASVGRFNRVDPTGFSAGDRNLYRYADNAPTDATDSSGLDVSGGSEQSPPAPLPPIPSKSMPASDAPKTDTNVSQSSGAKPPKARGRVDEPPGGSEPGTGNQPFNDPGENMTHSQQERLRQNPSESFTTDFQPLRPAPFVTPPPGSMFVYKDGTQVQSNGSVSYPGKHIYIAPNGEVWTQSRAGTWYFRNYIPPLPGHSNPRFPAASQDEHF